MDTSLDQSSLTPLAGGWSGETFLGRTGAEQVVVRVYGERATRGRLSPEIDAALLRLVRGLLPVAAVLEVRPADPETGRPGVLVTELMPGVRADELLPGVGDRDAEIVGRAVGSLLGALGAMPMPSAGPFVDATLRIGTFGDHPGDGLPEFLDDRARDLAHLRPAEMDGLRAVAVDAQTLLDGVERHCLVHCDVNPKNLLLDAETLEVTALLDWEFAHAGHPFTDLGNVLRFDREPAYADAVVDRYVEMRGGTSEAALALARAADLLALIDLACRRQRSPVAARADRLLREIARTREVMAAEPR